MSNLISVVMPAYKAQKSIVGTVRSVIDQTHEEWELVLVSDDLFDYQVFLKENGIEDARIKFFSTGKNGSGAVAARNMAIENVTGPYVAILDSDDEFYPEKLALVLEPLKEYGLVSSAIEIRDDTDGFIRNVGEREQDAVLKAEDYIFVNYSTHSSVVYDHSKMPVMGDDRFRVIEDHIAMLERFTHVDCLYHFGKPLHKYYKYEQSVSVKNDAFNAFIEQKEEVLRRVKSGHYAFKDDGIQKAYQRFYELSLKAENTFGTAREQNPSLIYEDVFEQICKEAGVI